MKEFFIYEEPKTLEKQKQQTERIKNMKQFELMYIVKPELEKEEYKKIIEKYKKIISENNGSVEKTDMWGKKQLAYELKDCKEGFYILMTFTGNPSCVKEIDRLIRIDENVLRHIIISKIWTIKKGAF